MKTPELQQVLVLSSDHYNPKADYLFRSDCVSYEMGEFGWLVMIPGSLDESEFMAQRLPEIREAISYARQLGADWIRFDPDGPIMDDLPIYEAEWEAME